MTNEATEVGRDTPAPALQESLERNREILRLLDRGPDDLVDALCEGVPEDYVARAERHVRDQAYFLDASDLAAKVIAEIAMLAGLPRADATLAIDDVLETTTARALEALGSPDQGLMEKLSIVLGVERSSIPMLCKALNEYEFPDRHVLYHCLVLGTPVDAYCERFGEDRSVVAGMLGVIQKYAVRLSERPKGQSAENSERKS